jgi:hemoglobin
MTTSLFDKYGGFPTVQTIVHKFYASVNEEPSLDKFFAGIEMETLMAHQVRFFCKILGGPDNYGGRQMKKAHEAAGIDAAAFATVGRILKETLEDAGMEAQDVDSVMQIVASVQGDVVTA